MAQNDALHSSSSELSETSSVPVPAPPLHVEVLDRASIDHILCQLSCPRALANMACCCKHFREAVLHSSAWQQLAVRRWAFPRKSLGSDWIHTFSSRNHLRKCGFVLRQACCSADASTYAGIDQLGLWNIDGHPVVATLQNNHMQAWELHTGRVVLQDTTTNGACTQVAQVAEQTVAKGFASGEVTLCAAQEGQLAANTTLECSINLPVQALWGDKRHSHRLWSLHASIYTLSDSLTPHALLLWDVRAGVHVLQVQDCLHDYQLTAAAAISPDAGGSQVVAASVMLHGACSYCPLPSLCFHKSLNAAAAMCMVDSRSPGGMVARYSTGHRSIYPHLVMVRDHFVCTSHAGLPLAVWDRRYMTSPLHQSYLNSSPRGESRHCKSGSSWSPGGSPGDSLPLQDTMPTSLYVQHKALCLSASADVLVGRGADGGVWLWDLSACLGWQRPIASSMATQGVWQRMWRDATTWEMTGQAIPLGCIALDESAHGIPHTCMDDNAAGMTLVAVQDTWSPPRKRQRSDLERPVEGMEPLAGAAHHGAASSAAQRNVYYTARTGSANILVAQMVSQ